MIAAARRREFWMEWARGGAPNNLARPATIRRRRTTSASSSSGRQILPVVSLKLKIPPIAPRKAETGFFYGFTVSMVDAATTDRPPPKPKPPTLYESMALTLEEVRSMRLEMEALRKELQSLKKHLEPPEKALTAIGDQTRAEEAPALLTKQELEIFYATIGTSVEAWANQIMAENEAHGWDEVKCNKAMRKTLNPGGTTQAFIKWMRDSRGVGHVDPKDDREYPCLKCCGIIDAPIDIVCWYLAREEHLMEYNDLIDTHNDIQEITPSSKICLAKTPQILFIQPRNLITFCHHKWLANGNQLVVLNQAVRHPKKLTKSNLGIFEKSDWLDDKKQPLAFALRGANFLSPDPEDPLHKTRLTILAHGNPGRDVPVWAMKTVVGALANLEPYRFFHRINAGIHKKLPDLLRQVQEQSVTSDTMGRTTRPAGIAQLGYACFWPNGGGMVEPTGGGPVRASENGHTENLEGALPPTPDTHVQDEKSG